MILLNLKTGGATAPTPPMVAISLHVMFPFSQQLHRGRGFRISLEISEIFVLQYCILPCESEIYMMTKYKEKTFDVVINIR